MNKLLLLLWILLSACCLEAQIIHRSGVSSEKPTDQNLIKHYYQLGLQYKNGDGVPIDYTKAYENFKQAADLGDDQSVYSVGYMLYKGFGCQQDYKQAAAHFAQGAYKGRDNSMYLYGLCFRNGYGLDRNEDSAKYWLQKAADMGYAQAKQELLLKVGENANDSAGALVQKINNAALPPKTVLNEFRKITPHIASRELITGNYSGYLLQYDWSGRHIISNKAVSLSLERPDSTASAEASIQELTGEWVEKTTGQGANSQIATARLNATLKDDSLLFKDTHYAVRDHYSQGHTITYNFESASLNLVRSGDSVYLAGSIELFSPDRKEPSKPLFVALVRSLSSDGSQTDRPLDKWAKDKLKDSTGKGGSTLQLTDVKVYPNPFASSVTVEFTVKGPTEVAIQLISMNGAVVYKKPKQTLQPGRYAITLSPGRIASGAYFVRLVSAAQAVDVKVIHH